MARSWYTRSNAKPQFYQTPRVQAVARERAWMARNQHIPYLFGHTDDVAVHLRKRARDRMHTIAREQQYLRQYPISRNPRRQFVARWNRANVGISGTHSRRVFVGHQQDGAYRRVRYHVKFKR